MWLDAHDEVAPGTIEGLYVVGSVALDDWTPHSDIDLVAVVADPSDPGLFGELAKHKHSWGSAWPFRSTTVGRVGRSGGPADVGAATGGVQRGVPRRRCRSGARSYARTSTRRGVGERLVAAIEADQAGETADGAVLQSVALGVARMIYTWETGDVTSKSAAGVWAAGRAPDFADIWRAAAQLRADPGLGTRSQLLDAVAFTELLVDAIRSGVRVLT